MSLVKILNTARLPFSVRLARLSVEELRSGLPAPQAGEEFDDAYLLRLRSGDDDTARHFDRYFRRRIRAKVWGTFPRQRAEDLIDDVMAAAIQSIMLGKPESAGHLPAYIYGICSNLTKVAMRPKANMEIAQPDFDHIPDCARTAIERLQQAETAQAVVSVLRTLSRRDREVLVDLFYHGLSRGDRQETWRNARPVAHDFVPRTEEI